jgi:ubiquinone/menaquinone biosynthesis C-methylase UbiE
MSLYSRHVLPWICHWSMRSKVLRPFRSRVAGCAEGRVLEIGIGSGLNLPHYCAAARCVIGIEPSWELLRMARRKPGGTAVPYELVEGSAEFLPFENASMDSVVTTWTLCTIPDVERALSEMRRVLRPDGTLFFIEHGRATEPNVARWQDRLDPLWSCIAGGCHLNRPIIQLIEQAGFRIEQLETPRIPGPATHTFLFQGRAIPE